VAETPQTERREVLFSGRVQGVGFRYTARGIAARFAVVGFVRNLSDGRVQLVVEGGTAELDRYIQALSDEMARCISHVETTGSAASGEFADFSVRF
jgi:acylphosphatase